MIHIETVLDYQIFQQTDGFADISVRSTVRFEEKTLENTCNDSCRQRDLCRNSKRAPYVNRQSCGLNKHTLVAACQGRNCGID